MNLQCFSAKSPHTSQGHCDNLANSLVNLASYCPKLMKQSQAHEKFFSLKMLHQLPSSPSSPSSCRIRRRPSRSLRRPSLKAIFELPRYLLQRSHTAGPSGLSPLRFHAPIICFVLSGMRRPDHVSVRGAIVDWNLSGRGRCQALGAPYIDEFLRQGIHRMSRCVSGCGESVDLADRHWLAGVLLLLHR